MFLSELGCAYTDRFQNIYFVDVQTGELKWSSNSIHYLAFSEDGRVFIYADVAELNGDKIIPQITAYDVSTGALLWRWEGEDELWGHGSYSAFPSQGVAAISLKYKTDVGRVASLFPARVVVFVGLQFGDCMGELAFPTGVSSIFPVRDALAIISGTGVPELHRVNGDRIELVEENGLLDIEVHPPRARIYIDNEYIGTGASLRTRLPVGIFSISGKCQLYSTAVQTLEITTGGAESIRLVLEPDANIPRPRNREKNALSTRPQLPIEQNRFGDDGVQP